MQAKRIGKKVESEEDDSDGDNEHDDPYFKHDDDVFDDPFFKVGICSPAEAQEPSLPSQEKHVDRWLEDAPAGSLATPCSFAPQNNRTAPQVPALLLSLHGCLDSEKCLCFIVEAPGFFRTGRRSHSVWGVQDSEDAVEEGKPPQSDTDAAVKKQSSAAAHKAKWREQRAAEEAERRREAELELLLMDDTALQDAAKLGGFLGVSHRGPLFQRYSVLSEGVSMLVALCWPRRGLSSQE